VTTSIEGRYIDDNGNIVIERRPMRGHLTRRLMVLRTEAERRDPEHYALPLIRAALNAERESEALAGTEVVEQLLAEELEADAV